MGLFSCSIPPSFVLSHNMSIINTTSNWLCSGAFHSPPVPSLFSIRWLLTTILSPHAPRPTTPGPAGSGRAQTPPTGYCLTPTADLSKIGRGPISTNGPSIIEYVTEPGDSCREINPLFLARRRRTLDHSLVAGGAQRQWLQARLRDGHQPQCLSSPCLSRPVPRVEPSSKLESVLSTKTETLGAGERGAGREAHTPALLGTRLSARR